MWFVQAYYRVLRAWTKINKIQTSSVCMKVLWRYYYYLFINIKNTYSLSFNDKKIAGKKTIRIISKVTHICIQDILLYYDSTKFFAIYYIKTILFNTRILWYLFKFYFKNISQLINLWALEYRILNVLGHRNKK